MIQCDSLIHVAKKKNYGKKNVRIKYNKHFKNKENMHFKNDNSLFEKKKRKRRIE